MKKVTKIKTSGPEVLGFLGTGVFAECLKQVRTSHVSDGGSAVGSTYRRVTPRLGLELSCSSVLKDPTRPQMPRGGEVRDGCLMSERVRGATLGFYQTCGKTQWSRQPVRLMVFYSGRESSSTLIPFVLCLFPAWMCRSRLCISKSSPCQQQALADLHFCL